MPMIGIGTWQIRSETVLRDVIDVGLAVGYRLIDTAQVYGNEPAIGRILQELLPKHGLSRADIFITSKVSPANAGKRAAASIEKSLENLKTDYLDLMLIHWPGSSLKSEDERNKSIREETWAVLRDFKAAGKVRSIGVSNFEIIHLEQLPEPVPEVNQVEFHPKFHQKELLGYCRQRGIHFQAYSSLGSPTHKECLFKDPAIVDLANKYRTTPAKFLLAWALCQNVSVLPRTTNVEHVRDNFEATKLKISKEDCESLLNNEQEVKTCWDPRVVK